MPTDRKQSAINVGEMYHLASGRAQLVPGKKITYEKAGLSLGKRSARPEKMACDWLKHLLLVVPGENGDGMVKERSRELAPYPVNETK